MVLSVRSRSGMTLAELVVALMLFSVGLLALLSSQAVVFRMIQRSSEYAGLRASGQSYVEGVLEHGCLDTTRVDVQGSRLEQTLAGDTLKSLRASLTRNGSPELPPLRLGLYLWCGRD